MVGLIESGLHLWASVIRDTWRARNPSLPKEHFPDLSNQTWVVTGATSGLGLELAKVLVKQHARVWIVGHNDSNLEATLKILRQAQPAAEVESTKIDYEDLRTVKPGAQKILKNTAKLHGIIHNAGVVNAPPDSTTKQGYEQHLGVNNLATQLLQDLLDPIIENTVGGRIVWLAARGHAIAPENGFNFAETQSFSSMKKYSQSKALSYIQAVQWTKNHPSSTVKSISAHPGTVPDMNTRSGSTISGLSSLIEYDVESSNYVPIYAAVSPYAATNDVVIPWSGAGDVRPDIYNAAHNELGTQAYEWIEAQIKPYK